MNPLVSVIIPCYNDGIYLGDALNSVWRQTYQPIEVIVIDDGSDDPSTQEVLDKIRQDQTCVLLHTAHVRPAKARNEGIRQACGKYILPLDADDTIEPQYIEKAVAILEQNERIGAVYCHADLFGLQSGPWALPEYSFDSMLIDNIVFVTALFRKSDWIQVGGFCGDLQQGMEDYDFWLSLLEQGKEITQLPEVYFHYRVKPASRTTQLSENRQEIKEAYRRIYANHPFLYNTHQHKYDTLLRDTIIDLIRDREDAQACIRALQSEREMYEPMFKFYPQYDKLRKNKLLVALWSMYKKLRGITISPEDRPC